MCSTSLGRSLLGWYCTFEDYVCFSATYEPQLPTVWRYENHRIRTELAQTEYPLLSEDERKPRVLDDIWGKYWIYTPILSDVIIQIPKLRTVETQDRPAAAAKMEASMRDFHQRLEDIFDTPEVKEVLQTITPNGPIRSRHTKCCPKPPFEPIYLEFPTAGYFRMIATGCQIYIRAIVHPALKDALAIEGRQVEDLGGATVTDLADILCRTFAGLEIAFADNPDALLPCFAGLVLAAMGCQPAYRDWLWHKFVHFEQMGGFAFDPIKKVCAAVWNMPEVATKGFDASKKDWPKKSFWNDPSYDELTLIMDKVKLDNEKEAAT